MQDPHTHEEYVDSRRQVKLATANAMKSPAESIMTHMNQMLSQTETNLDSTQGVAIRLDIPRELVNTWLRKDHRRLQQAAKDIVGNHPPDDPNLGFCVVLEELATENWKSLIQDHIELYLAVKPSGEWGMRLAVDSDRSGRISLC